MLAHPELSHNDKKLVYQKSSADGKAVCFIDNHSINKKSEIEYHHIGPYLFEEKLDISNIAMVCRKHHREMGYLSIKEYKTLKEMESFFGTGELRRLDDVLELKTTGKNKDNIMETFYSELNEADNTVSIYFDRDSSPVRLPLSTCPSTGFKYFYAVLPVRFIHNDIELQPRPLELKRLWDLYRHLLVNTQLTPSICRLVDSRINLFDGQHKAAAQIWAGRTELECKVYINPAIKVLKETNLVAHDKLRQMPFFTSVLINKWASIFAEEWKEYMELKGEKTEAGFVAFLVAKGKKKIEAVHMIQSNIYDSILEDSNSRIKKYLAEYGSEARNPLTVFRLKQSILKRFIANQPLTIDIEESDRLREVERKNLIRLLNIITDFTLDGAWNPSGENENHSIVERIFLSGSFKAWTAVLRDVISTILELYDENERKEILLREISSEKWVLIENSMETLFSHRVWSDDSQENYNNLRMGNENLVRKYLARKGLNANWIINNIYETGTAFID
jgi:hypothetical protein